MTTHVALRQAGLSIALPEGVTILDAALADGIDYPHGCRSGRCGSCKSRLVSGEVDLLDHSRFALSGEVKAQGLILACRAIPTTDAIVALLGGDEETPSHPRRRFKPPTATRFDYCTDPTRIATRRSVLEAIDDPDCTIVDNRSREEFEGSARRARHGGAIPNARHCDSVNLYEPDTGRMKSGDELRSIFDAIDVTPGKDITVYCNTGYRSAHAYLALRLLGFPRVRNYVGSWQEWGNRDGLPITRAGSRYP